MGYIEKRNKIDELKQQIEAHGELTPELKNKINYKFRLDWNYYSNSMEGNTLTMDETRSLMIGNLTVGGKPIKDVLEMRGHDEVISDILKIGKGQIRLSEKRIKDIHTGIMREDDPLKQKDIGKWKTDPNYLYNYKNERFEFVPPDEVPERIHDLLNRTNAAIDAILANKKDAPHPIDIALQFHLDYVLIHPFYDGNGRTARILTNLLLISFGYPPFWIKTDERTIYSQYIGDIQGYSGEPKFFFDFCADKILRSQQIMLNTIEGKQIEDQDELDKKLSLLKLEISGKDTDNEVQLQFNKEAFLFIYDNWLRELIRGCIVTIRKFDELYVTVSHSVNVETGITKNFSGGTIFGQPFYSHTKSENEILDDLRKGIESSFISSDTQVSVVAQYGTFTKGALVKPFGGNYELHIYFDYVKYEIYIHRFFPGKPPIITDALIDEIKENEAAIVAFAQDGQIYTGQTNEDYEKLKRENTIVSYYKAEDILQGKIKGRHMFRFTEPRLLHKPLTDEEIKAIHKQFGETLYEHIDYYTKQAGLR